MKKKISMLLTLTMVLSFTFTMGIQKAFAASVTGLSDAVTTMAPSTVADHTIVFTTPGTMANTDTIVLTFDAGYSFGSVATTDVSITPATNLGITSVVGNVITITASGAVSAGQFTVKVGLNVAGGAHQITNGNAGSNKTITISGKFSGVLATAFVADVVSVDATVDPTLSFSLSANAVHFGSITSAAKKYADTATTGALSEPVNGSPITMTASTNATAGLTITAQSVNSNNTAGLYSTGTSHEIAAMAGGSHAIAAGTEGFALHTKNTSGLTLATGFSGEGVGSTTVISTTPQNIATTTTYTNAATADLSFTAAVAASTPAGSYATNITVVATGNF